MKISITHFQNSSEKGLELSGLIVQEFNNIELNGVKTEVRVVERGNQFDFVQACLGDDVVIFDGSVEDEKGSNYEAATAQATCMDHVLVVGRTKLPLNFFGLRKGGHPELIKSSTKEADKDDFDNDRIIKWIRTNLYDLSKDLPRSEEDRISITSFSEMSNYADKLNVVSQKIMERSLDKYNTRDNIIISYLSKYSCHHKNGISFHGKYVEDLRQFIKKERNIDISKICYFPPGSISSELMIEQRRWQIISIIDRYIRLCKEFWIFETPDYYDSWWTQAELASLAYIRCFTPENCPEIFICTVSENGITYRKADSNFDSVLSERHKSEMARFFSNSDPATVGYESVENMWKLRKLPRFLQWINFKAVKTAASSGLMGGTLIDDALGDFDFDRFLESVNSYVYDQKFWKDYLITCPYCIEKNPKKNKYDFEKFLYSKDRGINRLNEGQFSKVVLTKEWRCAKCGKAFNLVEEINQHFIWWAVRMGKATGPDGCYIERRKLFSIVEKNCLEKK